MKPVIPTGCKIRGGRYYRVIFTGRVNGVCKHKWHSLTRVSEGLPALYRALADLGSRPSSDTRMKSRISQWLQGTLPGQIATEQKEVARKAVIVSAAFTEFDTTEVQAKHILAFLKQWETAGKLRMAQSYRNFLNLFFNWVIIQGDRADNPVEPVRTKAPKPNMRYMDHASFKLIRAKLLGNDGKAASGVMYQACIDLLYLTGQSGMDIRGLRWSDIDEAAGLIRFRPRTKTASTTGARVDYPITQAIAFVLDRAKRLMLGKSRLSPYVVHTLEGSAYTAHGINTAWRRARERAFAEHPDMPMLLKMTTKDLRAKHATDAKAKGYSTEQIGEGLAHADVSMTTVYLKQRMAKVGSVNLEVPE